RPPGGGAGTLARPRPPRPRGRRRGRGPRAPGPQLGLRRGAGAPREGGMSGLPQLPHLATPAWLLLLTALPLLAWLHHRRRALGALTYSRLPAGARAGVWRLHLPFYARLLALGCLIFALARPQLGYAWEESLTEGIDIAIVLDISGSMG